MGRGGLEQRLARSAIREGGDRLVRASLVLVGAPDRDPRIRGLPALDQRDHRSQVFCSTEAPHGTYTQVVSEHLRRRGLRGAFRTRPLLALGPSAALRIGSSAGHLAFAQVGERRLQV